MVHPNKSCMITAGIFVGMFSVALLLCILGATVFHEPTLAPLNQAEIDAYEQAFEKVSSAYEDNSYYTKTYVGEDGKIYAKVPPNNYIFAPDTSDWYGTRMPFGYGANEEVELDRHGLDLGISLDEAWSEYVRCYPEIPETRPEPITKEGHYTSPTIGTYIGAGIAGIGKLGCWYWLYNEWKSGKPKRKQSSSEQQPLVHFGQDDDTRQESEIEYHNTIVYENELAQPGQVYPHFKRRRRESYSETTRTQEHSMDYPVPGARRDPIPSAPPLDNLPSRAEGELKSSTADNAPVEGTQTKTIQEQFDEFDFNEFGRRRLPQILQHNTGNNDDVVETLPTVAIVILVMLFVIFYGYQRVAQTTKH